MRTIKFRGKRVDNGEWWSGYYVKKWIQTLKNDGRFEHHILNQVVDEEGEMWNESFDVIPETIGQFTGQTDANGKEIYEGDILADEQGKDKIVVYWDEEDGVWLPDELPDCKGVCYYPMWTILVVIGNIHDNPELLESK